MGKGKSGNLEVEVYFSKPIGNPYKDAKNVIRYSPRDVVIRGDHGNVVEEVKGCIFPEGWSLHSANTTATKYFRKKGVPETGREVDVRQLVERVAGTIKNWGIEQRYFNAKNGKNLEYEIAALTLGQYGAFNSPVWFNLGLDRYDIKGAEKSGDSFYFDLQKGKVVKTNKFLGQVSACFIVSPEDSIKSMMEVAAVTSAEIFRRGSGIGGDWSYIRSAGEPISGGGKASGAREFRDVQDSVARVIKSGGITRRAATMQSVGIWHPDVIATIKQKYQEEMKARILIENGSPQDWESHTTQDLRGQNVNISIRIDDAFWRAYENNEKYQIRRVTDNAIVSEIPARDLLKLIAGTAHGCGDPGIQNHTIINRWNTCKNSGEIWASNPCSEYMFLNNSACNLASLNLLRFRKQDGTFDIDSFCKAVDIYITSQDILVSHAAYPTKEIAFNSHIFRPLGLGYANLGAYIMSLGLPYDSDEARDFASAVTSLMTAEANLQSTKLAEKLGEFQEFKKNREPMLGVIDMHRKAANGLKKREGLEFIVDEANKRWNAVIERGNKYGFRNAQVTLLAPTGTIGFMMDCDTTGCEPEWQLKKTKELAGGGFMEIVNKTVPLALGKLGYEKKDISRIEYHINKYGTVEGCGFLRGEHLSVFDCAISSEEGERYISPMGHLKMLGAIQPHISGAISKTVNCPENTTAEEIENMFYEGWKLGIKSVAIYREGSKVSQPLKKKKSSGIIILKRSEREPLPKERDGTIQKVKVGGIPMFVIAGEYPNGRLGELFIDSLERGSEVNRLLNENAIQFSEKLQYGVPLIEALDIFKKAGQSQISGLTDHPFIPMAKGPEGFLYDWVRAHYLGDISFITKESEMRPIPTELKVYHKVPKLHLIPTIAGEKMYAGVPSLEETIKRISGINYWLDEGTDTRGTIEKIKRTRAWKGENAQNMTVGRITGRTCDACGSLMIIDGGCWRCIRCRTSTGGCGGG